MGRAEDLVRATGNFLQLDDALEACINYFKEFPNGPFVGDMRTTYEFLMGLQAVILRSQKKLKEPSGLGDVMFAHFSAPVPPVLSNGLITELRIVDPADRERVANELANMVKGMCRPFVTAFEQEHARLQTLLVNGEYRAKLEGLSFEDAMDRASVYYEAYERGDFAAARRGFEWLRDMAPDEAYHHQMLGSIAAQESRSLDAMVEFLLAYRFNPGEPRAAYNAMWYFLRLGFHTLAFEIWCHYRRCGRGGADPACERDVATLASWAKVGSAMLMIPFAGVGPESVGPGGVDVLEALEPGPRPWLAEPPVMERSMLERERVFISYRRSDGLEMSQRLELALSSRYPGMWVFRDNTRMKGGQVFLETISEALSNATIVLVLIGPSWSTPDGIARLRAPGDVVRMEVAGSLKGAWMVVPVLLEDASLPRAADLPDELASIASLHAERLRSKVFERDVDSILAAMAYGVQLRERRADEFSRLIEHSNELSEKDPEAGAQFDERWLGRAKEELHHSYATDALAGQGIPMGLIELVGEWECQAMRGTHEEFLLRFTTADSPRSPVVGSKTYRNRASQVTRSVAFEGRWHTFKDPKRAVIVGIILHVVEETGLESEIVVPMHKMLGNVVRGTSPDGLTFSSRKSK